MKWAARKRRPFCLRRRLAARTPPRDATEDFAFLRFFPTSSRPNRSHMNVEAPKRMPVAAVGIVCMRGNEVLLIKRGSPPLQDRWSLPGGRIEWGERARAAALRELKEETGCEAEIVALIDVVDAVLSQSGAESATPAQAPWGHYVLIDYAARWTGGEPRAGDDAADARFFSPTEIEALGLWSETLRIITAARALL